MVARIVEAEPIPGSDHLTKTVVDDGTTRRTVVCGAPNAQVGVLSALALPGTTLPGTGLSGTGLPGGAQSGRGDTVSSAGSSADSSAGSSEGATVERREVLGVVSDGMLCSPRELGVYDYAGGLIVFADDVAPGTELSSAWPAETVLELELTPNRADAFGMLGVARDLAAKLDRPLRHPAEHDAPGDEQGDDGLTVEIEDAAGCPHLVLQRIDGLTIGPSPIWLQRRLAALGLRPRNNVVDVTNYVTYELGQPSHAYDLRVLEGGVLQVRDARPGEEVELLDGERYELDPADLVIATGAQDGHGSKAVGLAGVMGGLHDSVRSDTSSVALEVAHFDPVRVRKTAKRHGLHTDAHLRFERGVDPALPPRAAAHCARLIAEVAGGAVHPATSRVGDSGPRAAIAFRPSRVEFVMAFDVPDETQRRYLEALGCTVHETVHETGRQDGPDTWSVEPPSWRFDLSIEEDLIEEVARLHGYEHIGATRPDLAFVPPRTDPTHRALRDELAAAGLQETIAYVFTGDEELARARAPQARVRLSNPQGVERSRLRTALHPGLLAAAATNRGVDGLALFEIGRAFLEHEEERLGVLLSGAWERGRLARGHHGRPVAPEGPARDPRRSAPGPADVSAGAGRGGAHAASRRRGDRGVERARDRRRRPGAPRGGRGVRAFRDVPGGGGASPRGAASRRRRGRAAAVRRARPGDRRAGRGALRGAGATRGRRRGPEAHRGVPVRRLPRSAATQRSSQRRGPDALARPGPRAARRGGRRSPERRGRGGPRRGIRNSRLTRECVG